jgi:sugar lactone lactonase YvrE
MRYTHARTIRGIGTTPRGVAIGSGDRLHAVGDAAVFVFDGDGRVARAWRTAAPAWAVAVAGDGRVFVGEDGQLEIFDPNGRLITTWRHARRLGRVTAIGFVNGDVLAGDAGGRAIRRFDEDGAFRNDIGGDNRMGGFLIPNGVVQFGVDDSGVIHAANPGKHRVERYLPDGQLLGHFGRFDGNDPAGFGGCCNPTNVAVAGRHVYVTEKADPRAKLYGLDGSFAGVIAGSSAFDVNCKNMSIAVDSRGRVYVADTVRLEVVVFEPQAEAAS